MTAPSTQQGRLRPWPRNMRGDTQNRCSDLSRNAALQVGSGSRHPQVRCRGLSGPANLRRTWLRGLAGGSPEACQRARGCGAGSAASFDFVFERRLPPRAGLWAYPRRLRGFPHPGLSPGGRGEPQVVAPYVEAPVPDLQPALEQERLEFDPSAGRDGRTHTRGCARRGLVGVGALPAYWQVCSRRQLTMRQRSFPRLSTLQSRLG